MSDKQRPRLIAIGIDGGTWDILKSWADDGKLPTFKKLLDEGVWGVLQSTRPPVTGPAWVSFATGKNPGKHNCFDFLTPNGSLGETRTISTKDIAGKTCYEVLDDNNKKCTLINLPVSSPPRISETVITSFLTKEREFIFPKELKEEIPELEYYKLNPDTDSLVDWKVDEYIEEVRSVEKTRFKCAQRLFKKDWDFFFILFSGTDWIQHVVYDQLTSQSDTSSVALELYKDIDKYIGWFVENLPKDTQLLMMSDHGFKVFNKTFFINDWLRQEGYLKLKPSAKGQTAINRVHQDFIEKTKQRRKISIPLSLVRFLKHFTWAVPIYRKIKGVLKIDVGVADFEPKLDETIAYSMCSGVSTWGSIHINLEDKFSGGIVKDKDYQSIRDEIIEKLKTVIDSKTGKRIFKDIFKKEEIYFGDSLANAPDIIFNSSNHVVKSHFKVVTNTARREHDSSGIFVAYGSDIKKSKISGELSIIDLAPTILHLLNTQVPEDLDGKVLKEIFKEDSEPFKREVSYKKVDTEEEIKTRIKKIKALKKL